MSGPEREDGREDGREDERRRGRRIGPIVMLLPLLSLVLALMWMHDRRPDPGPRAEPPRTGGVHDVDGYGGTFELADGVRVVASLTRLHADPERQRFDAAALAARLAHAWPEAQRDGEPWRLSLRLLAPATLAPGDGARDRAEAERDPGGEPPAASAFAIERLLVTDALGPALATAPRRAVASDAVADPLLALLAPPRGLFAVGETLDLFLWGRAPGEGAELVGLVDPTNEAGVDAGATLAIPLVRRPVSSADVAGSLARLERDGGGRR